MADSKTVTIPRSVLTSIAGMKRGLEKSDAYDVVIRYVLDGTEPDAESVSGPVYTIFEMARTLIDLEKK